MNKVITLILLVVILALSGCGGNAADNSKSNLKTVYSIVDSRGKRISFDKKPERIISLHVSTDEILLDMVDSRRILSVSKGGRERALSHVVDKAKAVNKTTEENIEFMLANKPDLVIIRENFKKDFIDALESSDIKTVVIKNPKRVDDIPDYIMQVARAVGEEEKGEELIKTFKSRLAKINNLHIREADKKSVIIASSLGAKSFKGTIVDDVIHKSQLKNAVDDTDLPNDANLNINKEEIIKANPDVLLLIDWNIEKINRGESQVYKDYMCDESLKDVKAVKNNDVILIPMKLTVCFTHYVCESIEDLINVVYKN